MVINMISVTRLNNSEFFINPDLIETIEETPDTVITLTTGKKIIVCENAETIIGKIIVFRRKIFENILK
jgi:Uncharacterized protein, possibly involved in motility